MQRNQNSEILISKWNALPAMRVEPAMSEILFTSHRRSGQVLAAVL